MHVSNFHPTYFTRTNLLIDISVAGSPSKDLVVTFNAIDRRLRVDGQKTEIVHLRELLGDGRCLGRW